MRSMLSPGPPVIVADCVVFGVEHSGAVFPSSAQDLNFYLHSSSGLPHIAIPLAILSHFSRLFLGAPYCSYTKSLPTRAPHIAIP